MPEIPTYYTLSDEQKSYAKKYGYAIMLESYFDELFTQSSPRTVQSSPTLTLFQLSKNLYKEQVAHFDFIKATLPPKQKSKTKQISQNQKQNTWN